MCFKYIAKLNVNPPAYKLYVNESTKLEGSVLASCMGTGNFNIILSVACIVPVLRLMKWVGAVWGAYLRRAQGEPAGSVLLRMRASVDNNFVALMHKGV